MTVGIVFVSHSGKIAEGLVELARQMAPDVRLVPAGGTDRGEIGTSFSTVLDGIAAADDGGGVVVLCDLGSAILTAETAMDFLDEVQRLRVRIVDAPLVEGGVAAAVAAQTGQMLDDVVSAASTALASASSTPSRSTAPEAVTAPPDGSVMRTITLRNKEGLHARPAAEFVKLASTFAARVTVNGKDAKSLLGIMALGLVQGSDVELNAVGDDAAGAVDALAGLISSGFGEL